MSNNRPQSKATKNTDTPNRGMHHHHHNQFAEVQHAHAPLKTVLRLLSYLRSQRKTVALLLIPVAISVATSLVGPKILGQIIDTIREAVGNDNLASTYKTIGILIFYSASAFLVQQVCALIQGYTTNLLSNNTVKQLRTELFGHVLDFKVSEFTETTHGEFMSRLTNDVDMVSNTLGQGITRFFETILMLILTFSYMLYLSPILTLVSCITLPLTYIFGRIIVITSRKLFRARQKCLGEINGFVEQIFTGQKTVAAFSREQICKSQFRGMVEQLRSISIKAETLGGVMGPTMNMLNNLNFLLVAAVGGWLASKPESAISVGMIVTFTLFSRNFGRPVNMLANQFNEIQSAIAGAERVFRLLDTPKELPPENPVEFNTQAMRGELVFKNVTFGYIPGQTVLKNFNAIFSPGKKIALVGETGCGKTTIISLISRFYEINEGSIELDGIDIRQIPHKALRSRMAVVLQDTHLFSGTIRENIAFGNSDATEEEIIAAAKLAFADNFIDRLPNKYDTHINQADTALSQGQCQLLAIARAALADPSILILDEATSYVDTRTEKHIQEAMLRLMQNRTSIIIAHRLSTIRNADTILVLDKGQIVEQGTHSELMSLNGRYAQMNKAAL